MNGTLRRFLWTVLVLCLLLPSRMGAAAAETEPSVPQTTAPAETIPPETTAATEPAILAQEESGGFDAPYHAYFGLLHAHTSISDGLGTVEEAFAYASQVEGLDFFAVTDHSDAFDNAAAGSLCADGRDLSTEWAAGKAAGAAVTSDTFLGLFGFEMSWPEDKRLGHITTFATPGWVSQEQEEYAVATTALKKYYEALTAVPGSISQFCHPGERWGSFDRFGHWNQAYDGQIQLLEVSSGENGTSFDQYCAALDAGWHVAPTMNQNNHTGQWGDADGVRTVVLAEALSEEALFGAIRSRRVYATQDSDLHLYFDINGYDMGGIMPETDSLQLTLHWYDPTDAAIGKVEVITEGGQVLACRNPEGADVCFPVTPGFRYYYLRITQPDGDVAVTAPVWVDLPDNVEILSFASDTQNPDQGDPVTLTLTLRNGTREGITPEAVELYLGETRIQSLEDPKEVRPGDIQTYGFSYTHPEAGSVSLRILVRARDAAFEKTLELTYEPRPTVTGLLIDGSHENENLDALTALKGLASEAGMMVTTVTGKLPRGGELLLVQRPKGALDAAFVRDVTGFLESGGSLFLLGPGSETLLQALGSELSLTEAPLAAGTTKTFCREEPWCKDIAEGQYLTHGQGTAVTGGRWLVKQGSQVILAWEDTGWGGGIFLSGCDLFQGEALGAPESIWQLPQGNRTLLRAILGQPEPLLSTSDIQQVRAGTQGQRYRIKGYVTAGTSNAYNAFPGTIYIQDDTGGIAVTEFHVPKVQVGAPIELIGTLSQEGENPVLRYDAHDLPGGFFHHYDPDIAYCKAATDYAARGGQVVKIQGKVTKLVKTEDGKGICRLTIRDSRGGTAIAEIGQEITSGSTGTNSLAKDIRLDRTVRAVGILHINGDGERVLRVRDCDEVVYVPPKADPTNPKTGDRFWRLW